MKKFVRNGFRFYAGYNIPGWPSVSFNRYVNRQLTRMNDSSTPTLHTIIFGITKKCGFQCEHCYEWEHLNQAETLLKDDLVAIVKRFYQAGVSQVQLTGGEPLNRFKDLLFLLQESPDGIDYWLYTTGYSLTYEKAKALKQNGLTGITISLDHHLADNHDRFRGVKNAYNKALIAVTNARKAGLPVCFSLCATREFISKENLLAYAALAKKYGVSFIQVLEPRAVGHYSGKAVQLTAVDHSLLNEFYETINYNSAYTDYPIVAYPGYYGRSIGCSGGGVDYLYVDMDGDVHNCPFCQKKLFSSLGGDLQKKIHQMKLNGCAAFSSSL
ncbi:MAG: radical SAM protein [Lacibacter sp.]